MKTLIKSILLGFITLIGCSCEPQEINQENETYIHVSHDPVPKHIIGTYQSESKEVITITPETITIGSESYYLPAYRTIDGKGCVYILYLENGTEIRLKYFRLKYGYITFNYINYYKTEIK